MKNTKMTIGKSKSPFAPRADPINELGMYDGPRRPPKGEPKPPNPPAPKIYEQNPNQFFKKKRNEKDKKREKI
jgi:hypothetical protein